MNVRNFEVDTAVLNSATSQAIPGQGERTAREVLLCKPHAGDRHAH